MHYNEKFECLKTYSIPTNALCVRSIIFLKIIGGKQFIGRVKEKWLFRAKLEEILMEFTVLK